MCNWLKIKSEQKDAQVKGEHSSASFRHAAEPWALKGPQVPSLAPPLPSHTASETTGTSLWILQKFSCTSELINQHLECEFHLDKDLSQYFYEKKTDHGLHEPYL